MGGMKALKALDMHPKVNEDFYTKTLGGGIITIASSIIMVLLFLSELGLYLRPASINELSVDIGRGETLLIEVDATFPFIPCAWLSLDNMDVSGDLHLDVNHDVFKQRLTASGKVIKEAEKHDVHESKKSVDLVNATCMTCYGAEEVPGQCCNTCEEVREAYHKKGWAFTGTSNIDQCKHDEYLESVTEQKGEGCRMWGSLHVNKVAGNFHFAPGKSYQQGGMHVHDIAPFGGATLDFAHTIHKLSFGVPYPGMKNPLDGVKSKKLPPNPTGEPHSGMFQYFVKVVPTSYRYLLDNKTVSSNQYSVTENYREGSGGGGARTLPGVFVFYDLSPIKIQISETKSSFLHFITSVCAIVGGVFTVSGIIDAFVYQSERMIRKKLDLGKLS